MDKENIKEIFGSIIKLILKYREINIEYSGNLMELMETHIKEIYKYLIDLNNRFSDYELRTDLDMVTKAKTVSILREELQGQKEKTNKLRSEFEFNIAQNVLKMKDIDDLLVDIWHLINEL